MAILPCKQCGQKISSLAQKCPYCGHLYNSVQFSQPIDSNNIKNQINNDYKHCPKCKTHLSANAIKCNCGYEFVNVYFSDIKENTSKKFLGCLVAILFFLLVVVIMPSNNNQKIKTINNKITSSEIRENYNILIQTYKNNNTPELIKIIDIIESAPENIKIKKFEEIKDAIKLLIDLKKCKNDANNAIVELNKNKKSITNKVIEISGIIVQNKSSILGGKQYEILYNGNSALLKTKSIEFQSQGSFSLKVVKEGQKKVKLSQEEGSFTQNWDIYREADQDEIDYEEKDDKKMAEFNKQIEACDMSIIQKTTFIEAAIHNIK